MQEGSTDDEEHVKITQCIQRKKAFRWCLGLLGFVAKGTGPHFAHGQFLYFLKATSKAPIGVVQIEAETDRLRGDCFWLEIKN